MEVSGQIHALATLSPGKERVWRRWWKEKFPVQSYGEYLNYLNLILRPFLTYILTGGACKFYFGGKGSRLNEQLCQIRCFHVGEAGSSDTLI
jgi:hypothetical protein